MTKPPSNAEIARLKVLCSDAAGKCLMGGGLSFCECKRCNARRDFEFEVLTAAPDLIFYAEWHERLVTALRECVELFDLDEAGWARGVLAQLDAEAPR